MGLAEDVRPEETDLVLDLRPGGTLNADLEGYPGPVFAVADRSGFRVARWLRAGSDLRFEPVPGGEYRVQLVSYERFYASYFAAAPGSTPLDESTLTEGTVVTGAESALFRRASAASEK
jgi:hypothetical protein